MNHSPNIDWQPTATQHILKKRAHILKAIREFFQERHVLEVETPLLCQHTVTDIHIESFALQTELETLYLQTSPEFAMKRLLAAGSGDIFQISKAFRKEEQGRYHQAEFTLLEWYRIGFTHHDLMDEMDALLSYILHCAPAKRLRYAALFQQYLAIDPGTCDISQLKAIAQAHHITPLDSDNKDFWLSLLLNHLIEPKLSPNQPTFIYDYPANQAALAQIREGNPPLAERFEVYVGPQELANGFHELRDPEEQRLRFEKDLAQRAQQGKSRPPIDERFLAALQQGLPPCAGVALGIDRLVMLVTQQDHIQKVMSFAR